MMNLARKHIVCATIFGAMLSSAAVACESDDMAKNEDGFILKVVAGSDKIVAYDSPDRGKENFTLGLLKPYFVICEVGDYYRITGVPEADSVDEAESGETGFVARKQVFEWPTREALTFHNLIFDKGRGKIRAWEDSDALDKFMESGDQNRFPPAFQEDLDATLKRPRDVRPYPVLSSDERKLLKTRDKRVFKALIPAALPPKTLVVITDEDGGAVSAEEIIDVQQRTTFVIVFDVTGSMEPFARDLARDLGEAFRRIDGPQAAESRVGFVFFRDEKDPQMIVIGDKLLPLDKASELLVKVSDSMGGGDDPPEPILDATYVALHHFPWPDKQQEVGRKILIGVLGDDAKPETTGKIDERVPVGLNAADLVAAMREEGVFMLTVQASPEAGPNLKPVLGTLGDGTGGAFIEWKPGAAADLSGKLANLMAEKVEAEAEHADKIKREMVEFEGKPAVLLDVLDGERLERLRRAGMEYNIEDGADGVLVREAFIIENEDLLEPRIQIEKSTLGELVNLFSLLGSSGTDVEAMVESISNTLAAIAGEDYNREESIDSIIRKSLGIQFRSGILAFDVEYISVLTPPERLKFNKRLQEAGSDLATYLEANQEEFDKQPAVWMPISVLP